MSKVKDLREEGGEHELLTSQSVDGLLGSGKLLADRPLESYLEGNEQAQFVLRNKSSGLRIEGDDSERTMKPADDYQTVALVTDVRVLFVAGNDDGDKSAQIPLSEIVEAKSEANRLRKNKLKIVTLDNETWTFPCSGETGEVADRIDDLCQIWANAERLLEEVEKQVSTAQTSLDDGDFDGAHAEMEGAKEKIEMAVRRIGEAGPCARDMIRERAHKTADWLADIQRELLANEGGRAHSRAQQKWTRESYEQAATAYETAIDCYQKALEKDGPIPADDVLTRRVKGAIREREILRVGPIIDADTSRRRAADISDPEKAASEWEDALNGYREMLGLDWGSDERTFIVNRSRIREQTTEIADDAILDYHEAGKQWLSSGDKLAVQGQEKQATEVYNRAKNQFEQALTLAREVKPQHVDDIESALGTVEKRLAGDVPEEIPDEEPLAAAAISGLDEQTDSEATEPTDSDTAPIEESVQAGDGEETSQTSPTATSQNTGGESTDTAVETSESVTDTNSQTGRPTGETAHDDQNQETSTEDTQETADERPVTDDGNDSVIGQIQSRKIDENGGSEPAVESTGGTGEPAPIESFDDDTVTEMLRSLSETKFRELVADLWEAQGWSTTVFSAGAESVYDVVAMRTDPVDERLLVWIAHRPDNGPVETKAVKRCATARKTSRGADSATLVTTGTPTAAAQTRADELDVAIVDTEELVRLLRFEGLLEQLAELAQSP